MTWRTGWTWLAAWTQARRMRSAGGSSPDHGDVGTAFGLDASLARDAPAKPPARAARRRDDRRRPRP